MSERHLEGVKRLTPRVLTGEEYSGWRNHDTWNFNLMIDNDEPAYRRKIAWRENFKRKMKRGVFDREKAKFAIKKYLGSEIRRLEREYEASPEQKIDLNNVDYDETLNHLLAE